MKAFLLAQCLAHVYPGIMVKNDKLIINGNHISVFEKSEGADFMDSASIADMLKDKYPTEFSEPHSDPGRIRPQRFMTALYGQPGSADLQTVSWFEGRMSLQAQAARAIVHIKEEIEHEELRDFSKKSLGSYNNRKIAGTERYSGHAYGIAIDIEFPKSFHQYWQWNGGCRETTSCRYPPNILRDSRIQKIVTIFERHGFIWGGKWNHYDTMHFEYRPEIIHCSGWN